jgi:hypothetical protein
MAMPTMEFPFPDAAIPVPGRGEFRVLPMATGAAVLGLELVRLTGPGRYDFHDGTNV